MHGQTDCSMIFTTDANTVKYKKKRSLASKFLTIAGFSRQLGPQQRAPTANGIKKSPAIAGLLTFKRLSPNLELHYVCSSGALCAVNDLKLYPRPFCKGLETL